jgi:hypothetical protein
LTGAPVSVTLIDKRNYHLFRPMLYQVGTGLSDEIAGPLLSILNRQKNGALLLDEVSTIDTEKRLVPLKQHVVPYEFLVLATGIQCNYFGHEHWRHTAPGLESLRGADLIRARSYWPSSAPRRLRHSTKRTRRKYANCSRLSLSVGGRWAWKWQALWRKCRAWPWRTIFVTSIHARRGSLCTRRPRGCFPLFQRSFRTRHSAI